MCLLNLKYLIFSRARLYNNKSLISLFELNILILALIFVKKGSKVVFTTRVLNNMTLYLLLTTYITL